MKNVWSKQGSTYRLEEITHQQELLPAGVYRLEFNQPFNFFYLDHVQDKFVFPYKIYGIESDFVHRVYKSWHHTKINMGVLLNGLKGTGKTVTAELICNSLNLPVILIQKHYEGLVSFLNSIQQDVIIFIDEYEKVYNKYDNSLLSVMDGAFRTDSRKMFLLTTNDLNIERNMLQRPSRIRYIKSYTDLSLDVIIEVVNDKLVHTHLKECTIKMISELPIITMDLVKAVVEEVNIHEEDPALFKDIFNVQGDQSDVYNVYRIDDNGSKTLLHQSAIVHPSIITPYEERDTLFVNKRNFGTIEKFISKTQILVLMDEEEPVSLDDLIPEGKDEKRKASSHNSRVLIHLEPAVKTHKAFAGVSTVFTV